MAPLTRPMWFKGIVSEDTPPFKAGDMVYGKLHTEAEKVQSGLCKWLPHIITTSYSNESLPDPLLVPVKAETVSEWTGLEDADGISIYENDIITDGVSMFKVELSATGRIPELKASIDESIAHMGIFIDGEIPQSAPRYEKDAEVIVSRKRSAEAAWTYKGRGRTVISSTSPLERIPEAAQETARMLRRNLSAESPHYFPSSNRKRPLHIIPRTGRRQTGCTQIP